jgi:hypothetical protein
MQAFCVRNGAYLLPAIGRGRDDCTKTCQRAVEGLHLIDFKEDRNAWLSIDEFYRRSKTILVL